MQSSRDGTPEGKGVPEASAAGRKRGVLQTGVLLPDEIGDGVDEAARTNEIGYGKSQRKSEGPDP